MVVALAIGYDGILNPVEVETVEKFPRDDTGGIVKWKLSQSCRWRGKAQK